MRVTRHAPNVPSSHVKTVTPGGGTGIEVPAVARGK
jgi:hypothetical protein